MSKSFVLNPENFAIQIPLYGDADPEELGQFHNIEATLSGDFVNIDYAAEGNAEIIIHTAAMLAFLRTVSAFNRAESPTIVAVSITDNTDVHIVFEADGH